MLVYAYHVTYGLPTVVTRGSNTFGPFQYPEKLLPVVITEALDQRPIPVYGDGRQVRDWLYVEDHCSAIDVALRRGKAGEAYNVGSGQAHTGQFLLDCLLHMSSASIEVMRGATEVYFVKTHRQRDGHR